jgi:hypothetical protein
MYCTSVRGKGGYHRVVRVPRLLAALDTVIEWAPPGLTATCTATVQTDMRPRIRIRKLCPRRVLRIHVLLLIFLFSPFIFAFVFVFHRPHSSRRGDDAAIPHVGTFRLVDDLLDEALHVSLSNTQNYQDASGRPRRASPRGADAHPRASTYQFSLVSSALQVDLDTLRAQACQILQGKSVFLVGPHETLYQLHTYLLTVLHPDIIPGSTIAPTMRPSCPGGTLSYSCPSHPLCQHPTKSPPQSSFHPDSGSDSSPGSGSGSGSDTNYDYESPTLADIRSTNSGSGSLLRFLNSGNLNPSPTQEDARLSSVPSVDPRTGARVIDSRWVRYAASSKADIIVLNRGPLPAPAWSYNKNNESPAARNLTWLTTLRALEQQHAEPLSDLFVDVLSRLDHHWHDDHDESESTAEPDTTKLVINAALHSTISTFLPSLLSTLGRLREHAGHRPILGTPQKKPVLWYGSWFLPVSCAPDSLSAFSSSESDPRHLLAQLLTQAEAMNNPWSAYYNAQGSYDF